MNKVIKLNTGAAMPVIGLGTWQAPKGQVGAAVRAALQGGYKHVDCAAIYGAAQRGGDVDASTHRGTSPSRSTSRRIERV